VPEWLLDLFARYGYLVVFLGVMLENTGVPVPGETALLAGAALAQSGRLSLTWVVVIAIAGAILGDNFGFAIGRFGGRSLAERYGGPLGVTPARLRQFDQFFLKYGGWTVFIARFVTGLRVIGAVLAGGSGLPWHTFMLFNALGAVVWCSCIAAAGYLLAQSWEVLERWIGGSGLAALVIVLVVIGILIVRRRKSET
jgi:membrane protein DedA with SNARE-associated domain